MSEADSNTGRYKADDHFAEKLKALGIESPEFGFTFLTADDPKFQPFRDAFAEYRRELVVEMALPEPSTDLQSVREAVDTKLIHLNGVHPNERAKCPIRPVDLQFCCEAWEAARSAGVTFRQATQLTLKTAGDERDYLAGWKAAIEDHQKAAPTLPADPKGGGTPVDDGNDIVETGQIAALVRKTNKTVLRWLAENPLILPHSEGGGGDATLWRWSEVRERIAEKSRRDMPEQFTGNI